MDSNNVLVGKRITKIRKSRGYTREKLSELADVSVQFLAEIEKGNKSMTVTTLRKIAGALLVTTDYIVNGSENTEISADIVSMLNSLSPENSKQAEKLLTIFIETLNANKNNDSEIQ